MKKKIIGILIVLLVIGAIIANHIITYAVEEKSLFVNLEETNLSGKGYGIGNPNPEVGGTSDKGEYIWNIIANKNLTGPALELKDQKDLYCVRADYGQTWFEEPNPQEDQIIEYNLSYDIQADRQTLLDNLIDNGNDADDVIRNLLNPEGTQYRQLLWIFDNAYVKGQTDLTEFLEKVGIFTDVDENNNVTCYYKIVGENEVEYPTDVLMNEEEFVEDIIADIIAVQKVAVWYYTNGGDYAKSPEDLWLFAISEKGTYNQLKTISELRQALAMDIYNYLITGAQNGASQYTAENGYKVGTVPANVDTTDLPQVEGKYVIETNRVDGNYIIGPIIIKENNKLGHNIEINVTNPNDPNTPVDYIYTDKDGNQLQDITSENDLIKFNEGFYISVSRSLIEKVDISVKISYKTTSKKLWLQGTADANGIKLNREQPLVELSQSLSDSTVILTSEPQEFDLALREYITKINGLEIENENTRRPDVKLDTLHSGTTATYNHRKDSVEVLDKDEVTYEIAIYNEGNKAGYATKIIQQLQIGLVNSTSNTTTVVSKDRHGNEKNKYNLEYYASTNQIVLTIINTDENPAQSIEPYTLSGGLDFETIEIKCKVAQEAHTENKTILTNITWIAEAYDSEEQKEISANGTIDRDSVLQNVPSVEETEMANYQGSVEPGTDLSRNDYYYRGQEDDDDFEKFVIMPVEKKFDLRLYKYVAAISKDATIEEGEYVTDTGRIDGIYSKAPVVTGINSETGEITYQQDSKIALSVEPGDYVLYTIRVYNEGEIDGYASQIKDTLPIGLEFVAENFEYNGIWKSEQPDTDGKQVITTTWYAKGKGAESNADPSDTNYKANLIKAVKKDGAISEENPDYIEAQVLCRVSQQSSSNRVLVNYAEIADDRDENNNEITDTDSKTNEWVEGDDDQDISRIQIQCFDLSLRKFVTSVNGKTLDVSREPVVDVTPLVNGTGKNAIYTHPKVSLPVGVGDKIVYTLRVYNEGDIVGTASEVKDYLPKYLTYDSTSKINQDYGWRFTDDGAVTTKYLANKKISAFDGTELSYMDIKIECIVSEQAPLKAEQKNIAEISEYEYNGGTTNKDVDSKFDNWGSKEPTEYVPGKEDDDDFEEIRIKVFDLSLRKFISSVNGNALSDSREPVVDVTPLVNGTGTNAIYTHPKTPLPLKAGDTIIYTMRVYNEGEANGTASEVKDYLPENLEYVENSKINQDYGWKLSDDGRTVTTTYLADEEIKAFNGNKLEYKDLQIECKISSTAKTQETIKNIAEISEYKYGEIVYPEDIDSKPDNKDENNAEDDNDSENIYAQKFDLALKKFLTKEEGKEITTREPKVKIENGKISYEDANEPVAIHVGDIITYTLRIYNEGEIDGYASEITEDFSEYLEYLPEDSTNVEFMWKMYDKNGNETEKVEEAVKVKTQYLSKENEEDNLIKAFDGETLLYKDVKITFKVKDPSSNTTIIENRAQISDDSDENGNDVNDDDSIPNEWNDGEDDQDKENAKVEYFDLSLLKFISKVIVVDNGKETITETGYNGHENPEPVVKVELHKKKINDVTVKLAYGITVTNEGDIPGYATEITDYVPEGLKFDPTDNPEWMDEGNNVISTKQAEGILLQPGESTTVEVILTWANGKDNLASKTNIAEISEDKNEYDIPDKDSTPDNKKEGEDDMDTGEIIVAVSTGKAQTYFTLTLGLLAVVAIGVALIKKFVL